MEPQRRRSPHWVRETPSRDLHGLLLSLRRKRAEEGITESQEWLWDAGISELEWRFRHPGPDWPYCTCELCWFPIWDEDSDRFADDFGDPF